MVGERGPARGYGIEAVESVETARPLRATISKPRSVVARGFLEAAARLREAVTRPEDPDAVYIALAEAANWLDSLSADKETGLYGDVDVQAVLFARHRSHHHHAAVAYVDGEGLVLWRPATQLPLPEEEHHRKRKQEDQYVNRLEGKPVEAVFGRLVPKVERLAVAAQG